jgi:flagellar basal-body rod protein FlgF
MNASLIQSASALNANMRWQDMIAQNLSASAIPGYRKQDLSFSAVQAGLMGSAPVPPVGPASDLLLPRVSTAINFQAGDLTPTRVPTDLAVSGSAFFQVQLPDGTTGLTRDGNFQLDDKGQLVTKQGWPVMSDAGPLQLDSASPLPLTVTPGGEVRQGEDLKGQIRLVDVNDPRLLTDTGGEVFLTNDPRLQISDATGSTIRQGYLENANTTPVKEMTSLITAMRSFESNQKVIQMADDRMGRVIAELGNPN